MSAFRPQPFATVVPLYSGEVVVQFGHQALRLWVPEFGADPTASPASTPQPAPLPPTRPYPPPDVPPVRPEPWRGLPPFEPVNWQGLPPYEPVNSLALVRGPSDAQELVGFVRVSPGGQVPEDIDVTRIRTTRWPWLRAQSEVQFRAIALPNLSELVTSPAFDPMSGASIVIHARGPYVDLTDQANPLAAAGDRGGQVVVVVHPPDDMRVPSWRPVP